VVSAAKVMFCATPGTKVSVAGFVETPAGSPLGATVTCPAKPSIAVAVTLSGCPVAPPASESVAGDTRREKSGVVIWGGMVLPPQPLIAAIVATGVTIKEARESSLLRMPGPPGGRRGRLAHDRSGGRNISLQSTRPAVIAGLGEAANAIRRSPEPRSSLHFAGLPPCR
jgi:hypothetical protein